MTVEKLLPSGGYTISAIRNNRLIRRTFYGCTRKEAIAAFRRYAAPHKRVLCGQCGQCGHYGDDCIGS